MTDRDLVGEALGSFMDSGWMRHLPHCALFIFAAAATLQAEGRTGGLEQVEAFARNGGLAAPAWFPLGVEGQADPEEVRRRQEHQAEVARAAAAVGLPPPQRQADVVELMRRLRLLHRQDDESGTRWQIALPLPLPEEPAITTAWLTWAGEHLAQVITLAGLVFIVAKLLAVSKFSPATAMALATAAGPGQVALGAVLLGYPFLMVALAAGSLFEFFRELRPQEQSRWRRRWPLLLVALFSLAFVDLGLIGLMFLSLLPTLPALLAPRPILPADAASKLPAPGVSLLQKELESEQDPQKRARLIGEIARLEAEKAEREAKKRERRRRVDKLRSSIDRFLLPFRPLISRAGLLVLILPSLVFLGLTFSSRMWLPPEVIQIDGQRVVAYVVDIDGPWTTLLRDKDRAILLMHSELVTGREVCKLNEGTRTRSLLQVISRARAPDIPSCFP